jgi:hypothetical protein
MHDQWHVSDARKVEDEKRRGSIVCVTEVKSLQYTAKSRVTRVRNNSDILR